MIRNILYVFGAIFIVIGLLGFVQDPVLGIFEVDGMHNIVHLVSGILAIWFARQGARQGQMYAKVFGVVYLLVALLGFLQADSGSVLGLISINGADNILHVVLAAVFLYVGFGMRADAPSSSAPMA
jgi:hypothetical protein